VEVKARETLLQVRAECRAIRVINRAVKKIAEQFLALLAVHCLSNLKKPSAPRDDARFTEDSGALGERFLKHIFKAILGRLHKPRLNRNDLEAAGHYPVVSHGTPVGFWGKAR
jgi:hypothetical protein